MVIYSTGGLPAVQDIPNNNRIKLVHPPVPGHYPPAVLGVSRQSRVQRWRIEVFIGELHQVEIVRNFSRSGHRLRNLPIHGQRLPGTMEVDHPGRERPRWGQDDVLTVGDDEPGADSRRHDL